MPWLKGPAFDLSFILLPSFISVGIAFVFADVLGATAGVPLWAWLIFILGIDVSHVYSTLFRTYFNSNELRENKSLLTLIPVIVWLIGVGLYSVHSMLFWRVLTYVAVFHFIRQQYGFLRLYCRGEVSSNKDRWLAASVIYLAALYPIIYWHCHQPRNFHWFIDGDFILGLPAIFSQAIGFIYLAVIIAYFLNELLNIKKNIPFNVPKNAIVIGTAASWYAGIVHFNGDMTFTITNVVSHGIPYMALVWLYGERQKDRLDSPLILGKFSYRVFFSRISLPLFLAVLLLFGFIEEGLWAGFVWREHLEAFGIFARLPEITARDTLSWLVPLLTLPQATHYVLDGFIWKLKDSDANWQKVLFAKRLGI
jgi:hypothetical protein